MQNDFDHLQQLDPTLKSMIFTRFGGENEFSLTMIDGAYTFKPGGTGKFIGAVLSRDCKIKSQRS